MKKYLQMLIMFSMLSHAQVGINTTDVHPSAILDLGINNNKALLITRVALMGTDDLITIPTPAAGLIVYNTQTTSGSNAVIGNEIYFFNGTQWKQIVDKTILDDEVEQLNTSTLGYEPIKSIDKNTIAIAPGGATVTLLGCKTNPANGHVYCAYQLSTGTNFYNTHNLAQQIGGYIVTLTNHAERIWVYDNILANSTGYNLQNNIWIGYNKVAEPGNPMEFTWITNENWAIDWTTSPNSSPEHWFNSGEPNNAGGIEGSCHIYSTAESATRRWNDLEGIRVATGSGVPFNQVIIEFNE